MKCTLFLLLLVSCGSESITPRELIGDSEPSPISTDNTLEDKVNKLEEELDALKDQQNDDQQECEAPTIVINNDIDVVVKALQESITIIKYIEVENDHEKKHKKIHDFLKKHKLDKKPKKGKKK